MNLVVGAFIVGLVAGAIVFALVLRNNKKIADYFYKSADWVEVIVEKRAGKNI